MASSLKAGSVRGRVSRIPSAGPLAIAVAVVLLSLLDGGYGGDTLGAGTAVVWILVIVAVIARPALLTGASSPLLLGAMFLGALLFFTALSLGWGDDDGAGFRDVVRAAGYLGAFVLAGLLARPGGGRSILAAIASAVVAVALIALASRLLGIGGGDSGLADALPPSQGRLSFPLGYWNALGALMALGVPALVHLAASGEGRIARGLPLAALGPVLLTAYMTSSRGALLAALIGALVTVALAEERRRAVAALVVGVVLAVPALIAASLAGGILNSPGDGTAGSAELALISVLLAGSVAAALAGPALADTLARLSRLGSRLPRGRPAIAIPVTLALIIGLVVLMGPGRLVDDFRSLPPETRTETGTGILSASGSGRAQFWGTALDAFADDPVHGIGAGGFASYWNRFGTLGTPTRNAHSEPLELLAELGLVGLVAFLGFAGVVGLAGLRQARAPGGAAAGAALGVVAAGAVGFLIDWTWQIPAVAGPVLILAAALVGSGFAPAGLRRARPAGLRVPAPAAGAALIGVGLAAVWAAGVLALATTRLAESERALAEGEPSEAARAARAAIAIQPWAAEPWFQLAEIERSVDNVEAAKRAARAGIQRAPNDLRGWVLVSSMAGLGGEAGASGSYAVRAAILGPLILPRFREFAAPSPSTE